MWQLRRVGFITMSAIHSLVPARFLTLTAHLVIVITIFWSRVWVFFVLNTYRGINLVLCPERKHIFLEYLWTGVNLPHLSELWNKAHYELLSYFFSYYFCHLSVIMTHLCIHFKGWLPQSYFNLVNCANGLLKGNERPFPVRTTMYGPACLWTSVRMNTGARTHSESKPLPWNVTDGHKCPFATLQKL